MRRPPRGIPGAAGGPAAGGSTARWGACVTGLAAVALIGLGIWPAVAQQARAEAAAIHAGEVKATRLAAQRIEQMLPPQRLKLSIVSNGVYDRDVTLGVAWALHAHGYQPSVNHRAARYLGLGRYLFTGRPMPGVTVVVRNQGVVVRLTPERR